MRFFSTAILVILLSSIWFGLDTLASDYHASDPSVSNDYTGSTATSFTAQSDDPLWLRYPVITPDGKTIVFSYQGDLFRVEASGGLAVQLTSYSGHDFMPVISHDGQTVAFASDRFGNFDVFEISIHGGQATRLTFHSSDDFPSTFSVDDRDVYFSSARLDDSASGSFPTSRHPELYRVGVHGGRVYQVLTVPAYHVQFNASGTQMLYENRPGIEDPWRKHHTSSASRDIILYEPATGRFRPVSEFSGEDRNAVFDESEEGMYYLSEASGTLNIHHAIFFEEGVGKQLTHFDADPVRFLSRSDDGRLCFVHDGRIYTMRPGGTPTPVSIQINRDSGVRNRTLLKVSESASEMTVSPNGKEIAFVFRGNVFATSVEGGTTRQITDTPEQERSIDFRPDGKGIVYAGERDGSWNLYESTIARTDEKYFFNATIVDEKTLLQTDDETFQPVYSPDGKSIAYLENRTTLKRLDVSSRATSTLLSGDHFFSYSDGDQYFSWSPDSKWLLVSYILPTYWSTEVGLVPADGSGTVTNLTGSGFPDFRPKWMMGGNMMLWFSSRDGMRAMASTGGGQSDAYAMFFTQEAYDRFRLTKEEAELVEDDATKTEGKATSSKKESDKKTGTVKPVVIELDGIRDRKRRLTIHSSNLSDAVVTPDGKMLLYLAKFEKGFNLWQTDLRTKETKILVHLAGSGGRLELDKEGKNVFVLAGSKISRVEISSGKAKTIRFNGEMMLDAAAERAYFFNHMWRQVREKFYDPDLHGADWDRLRDTYARYLPFITNKYDLAELFSEILGELNASHTGGRYRLRDSDGDATASIGVYFDQQWTGEGMRIADIMPKGPLDEVGSDVGPGTILTSIDGKSIAGGSNVWPALNRKPGKHVRLGFKNPASGKVWEQRIKAISASAESQLAYERWVYRRRELTDSLSGGRLGYVHVRGMNDSSYRTVIEELMGEQVTREGVVVDTRFNGGGDLVDDLSTFLLGKQYMTFTTRSGRLVGMEPQHKWAKPSIVLAGAANYSDAHCFPYAYQALGIGKVVGMPVAGTCTFVWWERLQDREIVFGIPNLVVNGMDGRPLENHQLEPDVRQGNFPAELSSGRDQQLERAIRVLLADLDKK